MRRVVALAALVLLLAGSAGAQSISDPGVTATTVLVGGTVPLTGQAAAFGTVAPGAKAYFEYVNAHGGVAGGRKIKYIVLDDKYSSNETPAKARELVEQDNVFLTFGDLGTPNNLAVRDYYNQQKVPQIQVFTGSDHWGNDYDQYKWTMGWQPDYGAESIVYSKWIKQNAADAKIAILYQNDDYGLDYVKGFKQGLGSDYDKMVIKTATYATNDPVDMSSQVNQLKASGATWFYVVATPNYAKNAVENAIKSGWNPKFIMNNVAGSASTWRATVKGLGSSAGIDGMVSTSYLKDPLDTARYGSDAGVKLFKDVMTQFGGALASPPCPSDGSDAFCVAGMASAYTLVWVLNKAQKDGQLTRQHVMDIECCQLRINDDPLLLPGMVVYTSKTDHFPIRQLQVQTWQGDHWVLQGSLIDGRPGGTPK